VAVLAATGPGLPARAGAGGLRVRVPAAGGMAVRRAVLAARQRLADDRCREVFGAFALPDGASLAAVLEGLERTPQEQLDRLVFTDGSRRPPCASPAVLAFTHPGREIVYVCASQFRNAVRADPAYAEIVLIHELLHTLGLGEDPPTSLEITALVRDRCGDHVARRAAAGP
jgi:hypothetical protein